MYNPTARKYYCISDMYLARRPVIYGSPPAGKQVHSGGLKIIVMLISP